VLTSRFTFLYVDPKKTILSIYGSVGNPGDIDHVKPEMIDHSIVVN
jgi:hypothetical protein